MGRTRPTPQTDPRQAAVHRPGHQRPTHPAGPAGRRRADSVSAAAVRARKVAADRRRHGRPHRGHRPDPRAKPHPRRGRAHRAPDRWTDTGGCRFDLHGPGTAGPTRSHRRLLRPRHRASPARWSRVPVPRRVTRRPVRGHRLRDQRPRHPGHRPHSPSRAGTRRNQQGLSGPHHADPQQHRPQARPHRRSPPRGRHHHGIRVPWARAARRPRHRVDQDHYEGKRRQRGVGDRPQLGSTRHRHLSHW
jgi:hypothetical protein